jgi:hypothetical protein
MLNTFVLLAEDLNELKSGYGGLIFMGVFFLVLIVAGIWWLKR